MVRNGCGQSGHETLKLTVSQERIDGMNEFFACWCYFTKAKSYFTVFWVGLVKSGHGHSFSSRGLKICYILKVVSITFLLVCIVCLKGSTFETRKNVFYSTSKAFLRSWDDQILIFQIFKCYDVIKCLSIKHVTHFTK